MAIWCVCIQAMWQPAVGGEMLDKCKISPTQILKVNQENVSRRGKKSSYV